MPILPLKERLMPDSALQRLAGMRNPGGWLISALESVQESHGEGRNDPGWFHPSDFYNECDAFLAFRYLGAPAIEDISARTQRIFDLGSGRDEYLKRDMQRSGISLIKEEADRKIVIPEYKIRGELDDWVQNPLTKEPFVIDYKTIRPDAWTELKEAQRSHLLQVQSYEFAKKTQRGFILYENKGTQELKLLQADFDQKIWQNEIAGRALRIMAELDNNVVRRNPLHCSSCPFFANGVCTGNDIANLKKQSGLYDS